MSVPKVPMSMKVNGRTNNQNNPLRVRMWNSSQPAAAWFATVFNPIKQDVSARDLHLVFPDASYIAASYCMQEVFHVHVVITLCNLYSREKVSGKIREAFGCTRRRSRMKVELCPIYNSVPAAVNYLGEQVYGNRLSQIIIGDHLLMGPYGNAWAREFTGDAGAGVTASKLAKWCRQGYPAYAVNATPHTQTAAMRASVAFNKNNGKRRRHYNQQVKVVYAHNGDGTEPIADCHDYLMQFFGSQRAAMPFVYDLRGILGPFVRDPFPGYTGQPGVVLFVSRDYLSKTAQRETIAGLQGREGAYGNLEVIWVVIL